jgi:hypothetical protein
VTVIRLLDTGALLAYAQDDAPVVGSYLVSCAENGWQMQTSSVCVAEAYRSATDDAVDLLDLLLSLPQVDVVECTANDGRITGLLGKHVGRLGLAHSCLLAMSSQTPLFTAEAAEAGRVLDGFLIEELPKG